MRIKEVKEKLDRERLLELMTEYCERYDNELSAMLWCVVDTDWANELGDDDE